MSEHNPYSQANNAYTATNKQKTGRALEAAVLFKSAQRIELLINKFNNGEKVKVQEYGEVLEANQKVWQIFADNMMSEENNIPQEIRNNIANLALFTFKRTKDIFLSKDLSKAQALVDINRNIASGLSKNVEAEEAPSAPRHNPMAQAYAANKVQTSTEDVKTPTSISTEI